LAFLGCEPFFSHRSRRLGWLAFPRRHRCTPHERDEVSVRRLAILSLRTRGPADDNEHVILCDGGAGQPSHPPFDVERKRRASDIDAQLDRGRFFPCILTSGAARPDETLLDFVIVERDVIGHS
jgi:hypothetical protein